MSRLSDFEVIASSYTIGGNLLKLSSLNDSVTVECSTSPYVPSMVARGDINQA